MKTPVIVRAKRTAIGTVGGMFKQLPPEKLGAAVLQSLIKESGIDPFQIDEVILGNAVGPGGNLARLTTLTAGFPADVPAVTIDRQCGSGLEAINMACRLVQAGAGDMYIAGGVESSSRAPWKLEKPTSLYGEPPALFQRASFSPETIGDPDMGIAAENVAKAYGISREAQDKFAYRSHKKAIHAREAGRFQSEIIPVNGQVEDEGPRKSLSMRLLKRMSAAFEKEGTVTAGNSCPVNDGASAVLIMSKEKCNELGLNPVLEFKDATSSGVDPNLLGVGPIPAVKKLLQRTKLTISDIDLIEFNEAFASQVLASTRELNIPEEKLNIGGGAIALGHPYGASGAILVTRLMTEIMRTDTKRAVATLGIGGGLGIATLFERCE
jgi:acetyl-CoA C-acetyltransferase